MDISIKLIPGAKVDMRPVQTVKRAGRTDDDNHFVSGIYDIEEDGTLELDMPMRGGKTVLIPMGLRYELIFTIDRNLYKADAKVTRRIKKGGFSLVLAELVTPVEKFQRREYYRLNVMLPITFITLDDRAGGLEKMADIRQILSDPQQEKVVGDGTILNISGGGLRYITDIELNEAVNYLFIRFAIETGGESRVIALIGHIVGRGLTEDKRHKAYRLQILFKDSRCQEWIIRYIFEQERKNRQKKLGV